MTDVGGVASSAISAGDLMAKDRQRGSDLCARGGDSMSSCSSVVAVVIVVVAIIAWEVMWKREHAISSPKGAQS